MRFWRLPTHRIARARWSRGAPARFSRRWLILTWVLWIGLVVLALTVFAASFPAYLAQLQSVCNGTACATGQLTPQLMGTLKTLHIAPGSYVAGTMVVVLIRVLVWFTVGGVVAWRRPQDWMALVVALMLVLLGTSTTLTTIADSPSLWQFPAQCLLFLSYLLLGLIILLFPSGRFVPRWSWMLLILFTAEASLYNFFPNLLYTNDVFFTFLGNLIWVGLIGSLLATQIYRYRRVSNFLQRQQTKWVVFAISVALLIEVSFTLPTLFFPMLEQPGSLYWFGYNATSSFSLLLLPIAFGIAILRYRLWDIDILINRTLVYSSLTALLALVYFGLVFALQALVQAVSGQNSQPLTIVGSTLAVAALFQPLRSRIQTLIDRSFYRQKYDAEKTLEAFSATLRKEVDLNQLCDLSLAVIQETMQPTHLSLWLVKPQKRASAPTAQMSSPEFSSWD